MRGGRISRRLGQLCKCTASASRKGRLTTASSKVDVEWVRPYQDQRAKTSGTCIRVGRDPRCRDATAVLSMDDVMTRFLLTPLLLLLTSCATSRVASGPSLPGGAAATVTTAVNEQSFIPIGGIEQWVTIKGASRANPVILVLHGGPGNPMSPYADAVYGAWQQDFTLVQWDQRGAGRTFGRNTDSAQPRLTMARMAQDGNEVASHVARHLGKDKVILMGGSWGSSLGIHMVRSRPELFHAYVGTGQLVSYQDNQAASYRQVLDLARDADDTKTLATIEGLGPPPWTNPRNFGILRRATRTYEAKTSTAAPSAWWTPAPEYATPTM